MNSFLSNQFLFKLNEILGTCKRKSFETMLQFAEVNFFTSFAVVNNNREYINFIG